MKEINLSTNLKLRLYEAPNPNGICLFLMHGMVEHLERYDEIIKLLLDEGISVSGFHYPGHGENVPLGVMEPEMIEVILDSVTESHLILRELKFNKIIHFAHSMGTLFTRLYIEDLSVDHIIFSGAAYVDEKKVKQMHKIVKFLSVFINHKKTYKNFTSLVFADFLKPFDKKNGCEFISSIEEQQKKYIEDPLCGTPISIGFVDMLIELSKRVAEKERQKCSISTPITFISGKEDSVGNMGKAVIELGSYFESINQKGTEVNLFDGRHELLNDVSKNKMVDKIISICNP